MNAKINEFLAKNPKLTAKKETVKKLVEPVQRDKYGCKVSGAGAKVNTVISDFVAAGHADKITPKVIYAYMTAEGTTLKESKIKGHVSWFNRHYTLSAETGDFVKVIKVEYPTAAPTLPFYNRLETPKTTLSGLHLCK